MVTLYKGQYSFLIISLPVILRIINVSDIFAEKIDILPSKTFFGNRAVYEIMWKNFVERSRPHMTIWRIRISFWIPKALNTHSEYIILISFPTATKRARTRLSVLLYVYMSFYVIHLVYIRYR